MAAKTPAQWKTLFENEPFHRENYYTGPLGPDYTPGGTCLRLWAPTAEAVTVTLYHKGDGGAVLGTEPLVRGAQGVWSVWLPGEQHGRYYTFAVTVNGITRETGDPYARAAGVNGVRSMIVDLARTAPSGWERDVRPNISPAQRAVWEVSVRDFSQDAASGVRPAWRGKYMAFTQQGTTLHGDGIHPTCLNYLKRLGVKYVQLMPIFDFGIFSRREDNLGSLEPPGDVSSAKKSSELDKSSEFVAQTSLENGSEAFPRTDGSRILQKMHGGSATTLAGSWFRYDRAGGWVLRGLDVAFSAGAVHAIVGGNGCGKSTMLSVLAKTAKLQRGRMVRGAASAALLVLGGGAAVLFSRRVTRPLTALQTASEKIADGEYTQRTQVKTDDEIGALSRSFDAMAAAVEEKISELSRTTQSQQDFIAAFTHEVKTPMTAMLGYADLMRARPDDAETQREAAGYIYHETQRLENLSRSLLALMGLDQAGALELVLCQDAGLLLQTVRSLPQGSTPVPRVISAGCVVRVDRSLWVDMLRNLTLNAQRACQGIEGAAITLRCERRDGQAVFTVTDTGCGIPAADLPRVTEAFYMVDKSRSRAAGGSGIGLALCARIAGAHGAKLEITSTEHVGTTVTIAVPEVLPSEREAYNDTQS